MAVAEVFLVAFLQVLFEKLASGLILTFARRERIYKLVTNWKDTLSVIQALIRDAEYKQLTDESVKLWLDRLRDLAYDLDDLLDEITTRALIQEAEGVKERTGKVWKFIPSCKDCMPDALMFKKKMKSEIEDISDRFESIAKAGKDLNLSRSVVGQFNQSNRLPTTSVIEPHVYGREKDKKAMIELVMCNQENVSFIPIVGMGGIGKTTLAQLVYNDDVVADEFDLKAWFCVSEEFDVLAITKTIFHSVTGNSTESKDLNMLQVDLHKTLSKKKFLLVLDDVWNKEYVKWQDLIRPFLVGLPGSKVLVTTRDNDIASMVGSVPAYHVKVLEDNDCLSLLAQHALGRNNFDAHPSLKGIGEALVKKCNGLPLAAKTLGGLLRSKGSLAEWEDVLSSRIWDLQVEKSILPVLRLSYHHLPSHLKNLFSYCSIFPKDYEFDKHELVLLWMGEGFLPQPNEPKTKEKLGFEYFNELVSRCFFQQLSNTDSHYVMHDLINDLAQFVAGEICYKPDEKGETNDEYKIPEKARHASFLRNEYEVFRKFSGFSKVKGLRTFLPMPVQNIHVWPPPFYLSNKILFKLLPRLCNLRVLSLSGYYITELPSSICALIHLRYLNLSGTSIVSLPDSLSDLYNLETLSIRNCRFISKLPPAVGDLVNLRHLDNSNTDLLKELPVEIGNLKSLQILPKIVLSKAGGLGLRELRKLELLRGTVALFEMQNVVDIDDAKEASMRRKKELDELHLTWANDLDYSRDGRLEEDILDVLRPHENLKKLNIEFYGGARFPSWIGDPSFTKLYCVSLSGCIECTSLPPLGQLPELKDLCIGNMPKVKCISFDFCREGSTDVPFTKLETLRFYDMPEWEEWSCFSNESQIWFPHLQKLTIFNCPKLTRVSQMSLPMLHEMDLAKCSMVLLECVHNLDSLIYLKLESVTGLSHVPRELVQSMAKVELLECSNCNELLSLWPNGVTLQHMSRLRRLVVADCSLLLSLAEEEQQLPCNLEILELIHCPSVTSLPNDLRNLRSLRELIIKNCSKIISFPEHGISPKLKRLEILNSKALESLPGDISNLERLEIKECPSLKNWPAGNFSSSLKKLSIKNCKQLDEVSSTAFPPNSSISLEDLSIRGWPKFRSLLQQVHKLSCIMELNLSHCEDLHYFPEQGLPPNLRKLSVEHCSKLRSLPMQTRNMSSLTSLEIRSCRRLKTFPKYPFPPNLTSLMVWHSRKLEPLSKWGLRTLIYLREFSICGGYQESELLADDCGLFPSSLIKLSIARFPKLSSLSVVLDDLTSLQHLSVMNCTSLSILPGENLLEKLWHLEISDCPLLKQRCIKDKGDCWPKIAAIPCVEIDGTYIHIQS